jgi:hypothetical protein
MMCRGPLLQATMQRLIHIAYQQAGHVVFPILLAYASKRIFRGQR